MSSSDPVHGADPGPETTGEDADLTTAAAPKPRPWLPAGLVAVYWAFLGVTSLIEMPTFTRFMSQMGVTIGVTLIFLVWWLVNRHVGGWDRLVILGAAIASPILAKLLSHETLGPFPIMHGVSLVLTGWVAWLVVARRAGHRLWKSGLMVTLLLSTSVFPLLRMEGLKGAGVPDFRWRWTASAEDRYLSRAATAAPTASDPATQATAPVAGPGDWPGFRGPGRDGIVRGASIATDWGASPPRQLWRRPIGPGWSSMAVVDGRLFTQEQRGEQEAVVCFDAGTGSEIWSHLEPGRFWDALSSAGPRATPTFADGRIYAQGATGTLLCLDAVTGRKIWSHNVLADSGNKLPDWGVASSPLATHGLVITYAGGPAGGTGDPNKALLAYHADNGEVAWSAKAGMYSYSSAQLADVAGREQVLFMSNQGLTSVDPASGAMLWEYASPGQPPRSCQPMPVGDAQLLVQLGMEAPTDLVDVANSGDVFTATKRWTSRDLKPSFNDFLVHDEFIYGFDRGIFCCVDLQTGIRKWKKGRYGTGQAVLLADQAALIVISDEGEAVLVAAKPNEFEELGRFQAVTGKTWNHPAVAQGRLYVRNAAEIACYELAPAGM